jgi:RNA polymerase sigma-70 factor (ECF subfamily)
MQTCDLPGVLSSAFLSKLRGGAEGEGRRLPGDLGARLLAMLEQGRAAWAGLRLDPEVFAAYVGEHVPPEADTDVDAVLCEIQAADLYLACACAHGVPGAARAADEAYLSSLSSVLHHVDSSPAFADEVRQIVRDKLFVSADGGPPKIVSYSGRHPLAAWMRVAARRVGLGLRREDDVRARAGAAALAEALPAGVDPELDYLKARYRAEFREAFQAAVAALTERERVLLRLSLIERLSHEKIALIYGVSQPTVTRWIARARGSIAEGTQRILCERLRLDASEIHSIAKLVYSELHLSLSRWLADDVSPGQRSS